MAAMADWRCDFSLENNNNEEAAIASVISELASISSLEEEQRMTLKAFLSMEKMLSLFSLLAWFTNCLLVASNHFELNVSTAIG